MSPNEQAVAKVFALYERFGDADYIGEPVSQIEHMSQAAQCAMAEGFDDEVVLAAFFHDIGHICAEGAENMGGFGVVSHERLGANYLRSVGFSERMARLVSLFTLTFANPAEMRADVAGKPVYLGLATNAEGVVRIKPQNLLLNLPLASVS